MIEERMKYDVLFTEDGLFKCSRHISFEIRAGTMRTNAELESQERLTWLWRSSGAAPVVCGAVVRLESCGTAANCLSNRLI